MTNENCVRLPNQRPANVYTDGRLDGVYCGTYEVRFNDRTYVVDMYTDYPAATRERTKVYGVFSDGALSQDRICTDFKPFRGRPHISNQWIEANACFKDILINELWWSLANKT